MAFNKYKVPTFQLVIQIGLFPRITRYFVSAVQYYTREATVTAGEKWLAKEGYEPSRKCIHTRHVYRGPNKEIKKPVTNQQVTTSNKIFKELEYWIHDKKLRKQLGIKAAY